MLSLYADHFVKLMSSLEKVDQTLLLLASTNKPQSEEGINQLGDCFADAVYYCEYLALPSALKQVRRIQEGAANPGGFKVSAFEARMVELRVRILDDCQDKIFYSITDAKIISEFYEPFDAQDSRLCIKMAEQIFGHAVVGRFPNAADDIDEAVRCLICARHPACVFHLMRIIEYGVVSLTRFIGLADPKPSWGTMLRAVERLALRTDYKDIPEAIKPHIQFIRDVLPSLQAVQHAWRNKVSHIEGKLIPATAVIGDEVCWEIFYATRILMRKLAINLPVESNS